MPVAIEAFGEAKAGWEFELTILWAFDLKGFNGLRVLNDFSNFYSFNDFKGLGDGVVERSSSFVIRHSSLNG